MQYLFPCWRTRVACANKYLWNARHARKSSGDTWEVPAFAGMTSLFRWEQEIPAFAGVEMRNRKINDVAPSPLAHACANKYLWNARHARKSSGDTWEVPAFAGMTSLFGWEQEIPAFAGIEMRNRKLNDVAPSPMAHACANKYLYNARHARTSQTVVLLPGCPSQ